MSKINRFDGDYKAFASEQQTNERTTFGTEVISDDLTAQQTPEYLRGMGIVGPSQFPTLQDFNAINYSLSQTLSYLHQTGVPEWNAEQEYPTEGATCLHNGVQWYRKSTWTIGDEPGVSDSWRSDVVILSSVFDPRFSDLVEGQSVELTRYHTWDGIPSADYTGPRGGSSGTVELARHNGGAAISLTRARPSDWSDQAQLADWFADSGSDELCFVRSLNHGVDVSLFGAKGDSSTNDTQSLQNASNYISEIGGGKLTISDGVFVAHYQTIDNAAGSRYYNDAGNVLFFSNCVGLTIEFKNAKIKTADGLHYGSFEPETGVRYDAAPGGFTDSLYAADVGSTVVLSACENVTIINPDLDGNITNQTIGGYWGDTGIQLDHAGMRLYSCKNVTLINPRSNSYGLDGFYVTAHLEEFEMGVTVLGGEFSLSGRQGFSWVGGNGVTCIGTKFLYTGNNGVISSAPGSGLDIEDNGEFAKDGHFINCIFAGNAGPDLLILNNSDRVDFDNCLFAGDGRTVWVNSTDEKAIINFNNCRVYGNIVYPGKNTKWKNCYITDEKFGDYPAPNNPMLEDNAATVNTVFDDCDLVATNKAITDTVSINTGTFRNTDILFKYDAVPVRSRLAIIRPSVVRNLKIIDELTNSSACAASGEHAYIDISGYVATDALDFQFIGDKIASGGRSGPVNTVLGSKRNAALTNIYSYTGDDANTINIPIGIGNKIVSLTKSSGNSTLRTCRAVVIVCSSFSGDTNLHQSTILSKVENGLGTGSITITPAGISSGSDSITITSDSNSLDGEVWEVSEVDLSVMNAATLPTEPFGSYTLPATGFPI